MAATDTTIFALQRNWDMVSSAVAGVDDATLSRMPNEQSNPMNWLVWHMARVVDRLIHGRLQGAEQLWTAGGWHAKFGMNAEADEIGMGWSAAQVAEWPAPSREVLMGYYDAANEAARNYVTGLSAADLERQVPAPGPAGSTMSVSDALGILVWDNIVHGGQIAYVRGYHEGMGWHR